MLTAIRTGPSDSLRKCGLRGADSLSRSAIGECEKTRPAGNVEKLARHQKAFEDYHKRLGVTLSTTVNHYNASLREFGKIDKDVVRITGERIDVELEPVERPRLTAEVDDEVRFPLVKNPRS
jgi:hypothetical protein